MTKVFIPRDSAALSVGADEVAAKIVEIAAKQGLDVTVVRTGSRGMLFLEPLMEVETASGRIGYANVTPEMVEDLLAVGALNGASHTSTIGQVESHEYFARQNRITFARVGIIDPVSLTDYETHGGLVGLRNAIAKSPESIVEEVTESGLRGRGGAGFPAGIKWKTVLLATSDQKYICCNADEGDSGTFADRMLMEGDPFT
ncbi:MAG: formate dehydrogenase, partial [Actinomycetes bacterium]